SGPPVHPLPDVERGRWADPVEVATISGRGIAKNESARLRPGIATHRAHRPVWNRSTLRQFSVAVFPAEPLRLTARGWIQLLSRQQSHGPRPAATGEEFR